MVYTAPDRDEAIEKCQEAKGQEIQVFTDALTKKGKVGYAISALSGWPYGEDSDTHHWYE